MLLSEIIDQIIRKVSFGVDTDDSKFNRRALEAQVPQWRSQAILISYNGSRDRAANKFLHSDLYQQESLTYNSQAQTTGADFIIFEGAAPLSLNSRANGCVFVGEHKTGTAFTQLKGPNYYNMAKDAGLLEPGKVYYEITSGTFKVWGNLQLRRMYKNFIAADPMEVIDFDPETDKYPVSPDIFDILLKLAAQDLMPQQARAADKINDGAETMERRPLKQNIV
jgi:hypothetical protein